MSNPIDKVPRRRLSRRDALAAGGALGVAAGLFVILRGGPGIANGATTNGASDAAACVLSPELTEGPYYIAEHLYRRNITEGKAGLPLQLRLTVQDASTCRPIHKATVEVWHADAQGVYSGYDSGTPSVPTGGGGGGGHAEPTSDTHYLRGAQRSDRNGLVVFDTIYPGWYRGRTTHIHVKVHAGGEVVHTGQLFFRQATSNAVYRTSDYAIHGSPDTTNATDGIYAAGGSQSILALKRRSGGGYVGSVALGVKR
jgi:protocatechuate 3,4-dioxygenase beta subunit